MGVPDVLSALVDQWDRIDALLDPAGRSELHDLIVRLDHIADERERDSVQGAIVSLLRRQLPAGDPVVALDDGDRLATALVHRTPQSLPANLRAKVIDRGPLSARTRILGTLWESAIELRDRGVDPDLRDLIRLDHPPRGYAVPSFQFDSAGVPLAVVLRVNQVLGAVHDPWGAAYWWLNTNVWLAEEPVDLIDRATPATLVAAAVAAVEG